MKRAFNKSKGYKEAERWDILQQITMSPDERRKVARDLKRRFYGKTVQDVRGKKR